MSLSSFFHSLGERLKGSKGGQPQDLAKRQVLRLSAKRAWPTWKQWKQLPRVLTPGEGRVLRIAIGVWILAMVGTGLWYVGTHRVEVPAVGGEYTEALVGAPQFINPLFATKSDVDRDLSRLVYSGLFAWDPDTGLVPDLADSYTISEDQKTYTVHIRPDAKWHNGTPVRASDVVFTIQTIQNTAFHSQLSVSFRGVTVSQVDESTVQFALDEPFAPFLSSLTVGILPAELWQEVSAKNAPLASLNLKPIGSGPYKFEKYAVDQKGNIKSYTLVRNDAYYGQAPYIKELTFKFYDDSASAIAALENRNVEGVSFVPSDLLSEVEKNHTVQIVRPSLLRTTALFFNQEHQPILKDVRIRKALAMAIKKQEIVDQALDGHGTIIDTPILPGTLGYSPDVAKIPTDIAGAISLLDETDYKPDPTTGMRAKAVGSGADATSEPLALTLSTIDQPEFVATAELLKEQAAAVGIAITIETSPADAFIEDVIKPRAYDILLTGTQLGIDPDPYPFWHSSQIADPGLNLSLYANRNVDTLLEDARKTNDPAVRADKYKQFQDTIATDLPAIFLYQSTYAYAIATKVRNVTINHLSVPADRFFGVTSWYVKTKMVVQ